MNTLTVLEVCAGAGGQALGLEQAHFEPVALIENDKHCCATLLMNRPNWTVVEADLNTFDGKPYMGVDLIAGGLPCPPFSVAGHGLGEEDERNLFPAMIRLVTEIRPKAIMIENVPGLMTARFKEYRNRILERLSNHGYKGEWKLFNACDFGVSQSRPRAVLVAIDKRYHEEFEWPRANCQKPLMLGELLYDLMGYRGWIYVDGWSKKACAIAPTIVGGSLKHGGPDLGPTRSKQAWAKLGVDGHGIANESPEPFYKGMPRLTNQMVARLQCFPDNWQFHGGKTAVYRQIGNAFPPPVAKAIAEYIKKYLIEANPSPHI